MRDSNYNRSYDEDSSPNQNDEVNNNNNNNQTSLSSWMLCLEEDLDKEIYVVLRDGRQFTGIFRSFDQYGSLCLEKSFEVFSSQDCYNEIYQGCMVFRGDNLMLCGLIDQDVKSNNAKKIPLADILKIKQEEKNLKAINSNNSPNVFEWIPDDSI
ncbi:small nuclear ribonucleoprotein U6 [Cryptosporidium ubiquitum]|uniref:U6 snRNA-associated Sm-like protein LSm1 n=1 Tax=Cryptosporidium ubiquitum TaxID=857276 RepID=A0A1J4MRC1_9CRYT|nr:small nuclear ribonucleoprotein U6 [Cryptosporidium ubiquitum]OII75548.1 small nuclear ribonucleoprotein U6 [Cryptosporidium ubiquitum]